MARAVDDYNKTVGSLERTVLVQARRMAELQVTDGDLPLPVSRSRPCRARSGAAELLEPAADDARALRSLL